MSTTRPHAKPHTDHLRNQLLTPITAILNLSEAVLRADDLTSQQRDYLTIIQHSALTAFAFNRGIATRYSENGFAALAEFNQDWSSPIANIISYAELLISHHAGTLPARHMPRINRIFFRAFDVRRQVLNLLEYARLCDDQTLPMTAFPLSDVMYPGCVVLDVAVPVRWELLANQPRVYASKVYLARIMENLLDNARKFTRAGYITITAQKMDKRVDITVTDTGIGIPYTIQSSVFQPFYQLDTSTVGLGLGLYIAQAYVGKQGGKLLMVSVPDVGTQFQFSIPLAPTGL